MHKSINWVLLLFLLSMAVLFIFGINWHQSEEVQKKTSEFDNSAITVVMEKPFLREEEMASDSLQSLKKFPVLSKPLNPSEVQRLGGWIRERGYLYEILDAGASSISAASGYESMTDDALRRVAAGGDRAAALIMGRRLLERPELGRPWPSKADMEEATQLLLQASLMGYTASLELLVELARKQAMLSRGQRRDRKMSMDLLSKAYTYAYLLEIRGDFSDGIELGILREVEQLSAEQDILARQEAAAIYSEWSQKRRDMGYPPFENGVPSDILELHGRSLALYEAK